MDGFRCSWELNMKYHSKWLWGGANPPLKPACDPYQQEVFPVPDSLKQALQIIDPKKQVPEALLHSWDFRRGFATKSALKRIAKKPLQMQKSLQQIQKIHSQKGEKQTHHVTKKKKSHSYKRSKQSAHKKRRTKTESSNSSSSSSTKSSSSSSNSSQKLKRRQLHLQLMTGLME